jgi:hypothetical protein
MGKFTLNPFNAALFIGGKAISELQATIQII